MKQTGGEKSTKEIKQKYYNINNINKSKIKITTNNLIKKHNKRLM